MMSDRRIDITGLQVLASVLATVTGAVAASYLGVAGTIIGAAVMSVASTAGSAVYKHYLGRTAGRLKELKDAAPMAAHRAAGRMTGTGTHTVPQRRDHAQVGEGELPTVVLPVTQLPVYGPEPPGGAASGSGGEPTRETAAGGHAPGGYQRATVGPGPGPGLGPGAGGEPGRETAAASAGDHADGAGQRADGAPRRRSLLPSGWLRGRPGWLLGGIATVAVFAGVVGGITVFELAAGKPLDAVVWHRSGSGTTVGGIVGGQPSHPATRPARTAKPSAKASSPTPSNSPSPSPTPSSGSPSPTSSGSGSPSPAPSSPSPSATPAAASSPAHLRSS